MLFNSTEFAFFFLVVLTLYHALGRLFDFRAQNWLLLAASYFFYGWWDARFLTLIVFSTAVAYVAGVLIHDAHERHDRARAKRWLALSLAVDLGMLATFKYFDFFSQSFTALLGALGLPAKPLLLQLVLPAGLSFYTFQSMGYALDVHRRRIQPTRNLRDFALFVAFFPQLLAGPIESARAFMPQLQAARRVSIEQLRQGAWLIAWGLFKKVFIADNLAPFVRWGYSRPQGLDALGAYLVAVSLAMQLYCDFSGYTDMARGLGKLLGIELSRNFDLPFFARRPSEFWRRWHMTLSRWFRDYLYLGLRRRFIRGGASREVAIALATLATFSLMGLWHGASWNFVVWGTFWGCVLVLERFLVGRRAPAMDTASARVQRWRPLLPPLERVLMFHLWALALLWVGGPLEDGLWLQWTLITQPGASTESLYQARSVVFFGLPVLVMQLVQHGSGRLEVVDAAQLPARVLVYGAMALSMLAGASTQLSPFVYFRF
jgi:D-alanyl-lipoteichoic acid acyltransferase DltB (MBOAT superfamily)